MPTDPDRHPPHDLSFVGCFHRWEYVAVEGRGTDYRCQRCGSFWRDTDDRGGIFIERGPDNLGPVTLGGQKRTDAETEGSGDRATIVFVLVLGLILVLGLWLAVTL